MLHFGVSYCVSNCLEALGESRSWCGPSASSSSTTASFGCFKPRASENSTSRLTPEHERNMPPLASGPPPSIQISCCRRSSVGAVSRSIVEVETGESVNHLEALAQWAHVLRSCVRHSISTCPSSMVDVARRLCEDNQIAVTRSLELPRHRRRRALHAGPEIREGLPGQASVSGSQPGVPARQVRPALRSPRLLRPPAAAATSGGPARPAAAARPAGQTWPRGKAVGEARPKAGSRTEAQVAGAISQIFARQARVRTHLPGAYGQSPGQTVSAPDPLLVSDPARVFA